MDLEPTSYSDEFADRFSVGLCPCLATTDEDFAKAAKINMDFSQQPAFVSYALQSNVHLFVFDVGNWDGVYSEKDLEDFLLYFGLPMPSSFSMFHTWPRKEAPSMTVCVELVPNFFSTEEVVSAVQELVKGKVSDQWEWEPSEQLHRTFDYVNPVTHRCIYVELQNCDPGPLGTMLACGLPVRGFNYRVRQAFDIFPFDVRHEVPPCASTAAQTEPSAGVDTATQTPPVEVTSRAAQTTPSQPAQQRPPSPRPSGSETPARRRRPSQPASQRTPPRAPRTPHAPRAPPPIQCYCCHKWNHASPQCPDAARPRCRKCAGNHRASECASEVRCCAVCGGNHAASSRACPERPPHSPSPARRTSPASPGGGTPKRHVHQRLKNLLAVLCEFLS